MPLDTAATTFAASHPPPGLRGWELGHGRDSGHCLPTSIRSPTMSLKDPNIRLRAAILRSRNHGKAQVVGQRVMPFVRINAATAVSRHVIGGPSRQTTGTKGNIEVGVRVRQGYSHANAFGSRTSLVRL